MTRPYSKVRDIPPTESPMPSTTLGVICSWRYAIANTAANTGDVEFRTTTVAGELSASADTNVTEDPPPSRPLSQTLASSRRVAPAAVLLLLLT